ncbi:MAG: leucine--tRNA ligase [Candidatus Micrarchaeia archaeon]
MNAEIERKWQERWQRAGVFESNPKEIKKFYLTAAFPYPNSPQHIGHARTYTTTDVYARYMRLKGFNVLFPMAFHVTGTPILAMAKRIAAKDSEILDVFEQIYKIPRSVAESLKDPVELVMFFSREIEAGMKEMGFSIDWRRKFYTFDKPFNAFIQWQFRKLYEKKLLKKGAHPVPWCPSCKNAIGAHDTKGDVDPEIGEYVLIKFAYKDGYLLAATFRPETVYGVTNMWLNPNATYVRFRSKNGEIYFISKEAAGKFALQGKDGEVLEELSGAVFIGGECTNPITGETVRILPATFVEPKNGTGVVMSVPAHAPYDYIALRDLKGTEYEYKGEFKQVLRIDGYGNFPAMEIVEKMGIKNQNDELLENATSEIYSKEAHTGVMVVGEYAGERVSIAKEKIKEDMLASNKALTMHEIVNGPVFCRCGTLGAVKLVTDQWFIDYGNEEWKELARECLSLMRIIPSQTRQEYEYTIGWLREKACTRASGLGTRFPFDEKQVIESLSDSTIYMAFYTIAHYIRELKESELCDELFDYVFLGIETEKANSKNPTYKKMRDEFLYWYPHDSRHSGADLVHNHLTFFIFNHCAIFPRELWPRGIVTNGFVLMEGKKMSKSMGNILPLREAIKKYGADVVRFSVVSGADLAVDADFNQTMADGIANRLRFILSLLESQNENVGGRPIDVWFISRMNRRIALVDEHLSALRLRDAAQEVFYNTVNELRWYLRRAKPSERVMREFFEKWSIMISPFMPHIAEEIWEKLGKKEFVENATFVSISNFPVADEKKINERVEFGEKIIEQTRGDIETIISLIGKKKRIRIFVASEWKRILYAIAYEEKSFEKAMKKAMSLPEIKAHGKEAQKVLMHFIKNINELSPLLLSESEELSFLSDAIGFFEKEFGTEISVEKEDDAIGNDFVVKKASQALPHKPAILLE